MSDWQLKTPVALLIFNRPDTTQRVLEVIRQIRPRNLLVVADGPRLDRPGETKKCAAARALVDQIDWPCTILKNYSDVNLGCRRRIASGLDWVFKSVSEAIVLEDDCVPQVSFFRFCEELLERYRDDARVMHISGDNFQTDSSRTPHSYYFSRYPHVWGWASWRRAWQYYDVSLQAWELPEQRQACLASFVARREREFWRGIWDAVRSGELDTWDYQWTFACLVQRGLAIVPSVNLVTNIGFGPAATHTRTTSRVAGLSRFEMKFPLCHPVEVSRNISADEHTRRLFYTAPSLARRLRQIAGRVLRRLL